MINTNIIKIKSEELNIPFQNMLYGCCLEDLVAYLSRNYKDDIWLINDRILGLKSYKKAKDYPIICAYSGEEAIDKFIRKMAMSVVTEYFTGKCKVKSVFEGTNKVTFIMSFEKMTVPLPVILQEVKDVHAFPKEKTARLTLQNAASFSYMAFPIEENVADLLFEILDKLELLNEVEKYLYLYDLLKSEALEGRKVKECLARKCQGKLGFDENRWQEFMKYRDYSYMKKKWKVIKRREKRSDLEWEEVFDFIIKFVGPLYEALIKEEVFFGDWMPELERFLD